MPANYIAIAVVNIRREPKIVEYKFGKNFITNRVGQLSAGTQRVIYDTQTDGNGLTWGRLSNADSAGIAEWVCIRDRNRTFMELTYQDTPGTPLPQLADLSARVDRLEEWGRKNGFEQ